MAPRDIAGVTRDFRDDELRQIEGRWKSDMQKKVDRMDDRLRTVERMAWIGYGGLAIVGGMVGMYGHNIMKVLVG